jgi:cytochrome c-type biogenesis protein CcmH
VRAATAALLSALPLLGQALAAQAVAPFDEARLAEIARTVGAPEGVPVPAAALEARTDEVTGKLRCPVCQGLSVASSHTPTALAMKEQARQLVGLGYSERQVLDVFEDSYGEFVRLEPKPRGFNLVVWIAPLVVLAGGFVLVARRLHAGGAPPSSGAGESPSAPAEVTDTVEPAQPAVDPYLKKLREEIRRP